jgi:hypothetical protein
VGIGGVSFVLALAALAFAGCGSSVSDATKVKQVLTREMAALAAGDGATACSLATAAGQAKLSRAVPGATCREVIALLASRLPAAIKEGLTSAQITKVTVSGNTATVQDADITSTRGSLSGFLQPRSAPTTFQKQPDGNWKISG